MSERGTPNGPGNDDRPVELSGSSSGSLSVNSRRRCLNLEAPPIKLRRERGGRRARRTDYGEREAIVAEVTRRNAGNSVARELREFMEHMRNDYYILLKLVERAVEVEEGIRIEEAAEDRVEQRYRDQQPGPRNQAARTSELTQGRNRDQGQGQPFGRGQDQGKGQMLSQAQGRRMMRRGTLVVGQLPVCFKCGGRGHFARARTCPQEGDTPRPVPIGGVCYTCNQPGHYANSCPVTYPTGQSSGRNKGTAGRGTPALDQLPVCLNCGCGGHFVRACSKGEKTTRPVPDSVNCFTCNQPGHYARKCPVTHPTGQNNQRVGLRAMEWEVEPSAKRPAIRGRLYSP